MMRLLKFGADQPVEPLAPGVAFAMRREPTEHFATSIARNNCARRR